ncbi:Smap1 protein [Coprinopsis sp. MPI-PUGE-AT-0042]|nr:Smap1 protein [Coprinopsis sp. MPI-PUGE-AT-0042]
MSRPDRATQERFTKTLREMVKRPENKYCADCKRNGGGVFLCIRCSGIHRGMGTHISKVKSVDLDMWTPEQMESIQKWGNHRANLYWEAHLKPGHNPPEHKMESFIRSKYESRRWARDGPPPSDPSTLEQGGSSEQQVPMAQPQAEVVPAPVPAQSTGSSARGVTNRQPQPHQLLSSAYTRNAGTSSPTPALRSAPVAVQAQAEPAQQQPIAVPAPANDLFSLDFHAPAAPSAPPVQPKKDVKNDIMSLFSAAPATTPASASFGGHFASPATASWGGGFGAPTQPPAQQQPPTSMVGTGGVGAWGASSGWNPAQPAAQPNVWATPTTAPSQPATVWGASSTTTSTSAAAQTTKKDDAFGDIWGSFK